MNPMESGLGLWIGLNLLITFTIPNISIGGHVGGLIGGALAAFVMFDLRERVKVPAARARCWRARSAWPRWWARSWCRPSWS